MGQYGAKSYFSREVALKIGQTSVSRRIGRGAKSLWYVDCNRVVCRSSDGVAIQ